MPLICAAASPALFAAEFSPALDRFRLRHFSFRHDNIFACRLFSYAISSLPIFIDFHFRRQPCRHAAAFDAALNAAAAARFYACLCRCHCRCHAGLFDTRHALALAIFRAPPRLFRCHFAALRRQRRRRRHACRRLLIFAGMPPPTPPAFRSSIMRFRHACQIIFTPDSQL